MIEEKLESSKSPEMLVFMPWRRLGAPKQVGDWSLVPFDVSEPESIADEELRKEVLRILNAHRIHKDCPVRNVILFKHRDKALTALLNEEERADAFQIAQILTFSSLSNRTFFSFGYYTNSSEAALVVQGFVRGSGGFAISARRRDGTSTNYAPDKYYLVLSPNHVSAGDLKWDEGLANALVASWDNPEWNAIYEGIFSFLHANSDDSIVPIQAELMFGLGAIERLLEVNGGNVDEGAEKFLANSNTILREEKKPAASTRDFRKLNKFDSVREIWLRDLWACRGDLAHGRAKQKYPSIWSPQEHLLLISEIVPLLVKTKLSRAKSYVLTEEDRERLFYFDRRLRMANLFKVSEENGEPKFGWSEAKKAALWDWPHVKGDLTP